MVHVDWGLLQENVSRKWRSTPDLHTEMLLMIWIRAEWAIVSCLQVNEPNCHCTFWPDSNFQQKCRSLCDILCLHGFLECCHWLAFVICNGAEFRSMHSCGMDIANRSSSASCFTDLTSGNNFRCLMWIDFDFEKNSLNIRFLKTRFTTTCTSRPRDSSTCDL